MIGPDDYRASYALRFKFRASSNEVEYEALIACLSLALDLEVDQIRVFSNSKLVVNQVLSSYQVRGERMVRY